ncbi:MAG: hypothetical protein SGILL_004797, partial [Bacillariaceae sp.]
LFYHMAQAFAPPNVCTGIIYSFFMIIYSALALCDSIVLFTSVIVTELLSGTGFLVGALTGGIIWGQYWHQQIRRTSHGIRVICRKKLSGNKPSRTFLFTKKREEAMDQQNLTAEVVPVTVERDSPQGQKSYNTYDVNVYE